ncbi:hypothetical protein AOZ06_24295 [Kibdelosporangium phytohabitans]|uniref:Uncharacterized protein n=2 Tax=Kibdelosporangium phytohabitans TaxID=860235 RepID=A0A0N7F3U5_9PSEU|nr:hypothetical protein AOZ06_24295 [Kibdelosporangium phytohabitans]
MWSPIVYGRTDTSDSWWRAIPSGTTSTELFDVVTAAFAGGADLDTPRFLLARRGGRWITGVACQASELSRSMATDSQNRELATFVGWAAPDTELPPSSLAHWETSFAQWAAPVYEHWAGADWTLPVRDVRDPHVVAAQPPPWRAEPPPPGPELTRTYGSALFLPPEASHQAWDEGRRTTGPFTLVVGWRKPDLVRADLVTHVCISGTTTASHAKSYAAGTDIAGATTVVEANFAGTSAPGTGFGDVGTPPPRPAQPMSVAVIPPRPLLAPVSMPAPVRSGFWRRFMWASRREVERLEHQVRWLTTELEQVRAAITALDARLSAIEAARPGEGDAR